MALTAADLAALPPDRAGGQGNVARIVAAEVSAVEFFERLTPGADLDALLAVLALTTPGVRDLVGDPARVPAHEWSYSAGAGWVMPCFTRRARPSRFSAGGFGIFYAAWDDRTAMAEAAYHTRQRLLETSEPAQIVRCHLLTADIAGFAAVLTSLAAPLGDAIHDPESYATGQEVGQHLRTRGSDLIVYHSVRHRPGFCGAIFRPRAVRGCHSIARVTYTWDGAALTPGIVEPL